MEKNKWYFNSVFYHIYPQSFFDTNGDGVGDIDGMIEKLDYIQSLGIDAIWSNSLWLSYSFCDAGYDIVDHMAIAPRYGDLPTFKIFLEEAHKRDIRVLGEMNFAATSDEHPWFLESMKMKKNRYSKWYIWSKKPETVSTYKGFWIPYRGKRYDSYYVGWLPNQPWLNYGFPGLDDEDGNNYDDPDLLALREELKKIVRFWLDNGVDGFRADAVEVLIPQALEKGIHPNVTRFWCEIRELIDSYRDDVAFIGEAWFFPKDSISKSRFKGVFFLPPLVNSKSPLELVAQKDMFFSPEGGDIKWFVDEYFEAYDEVVKNGGMLHLVSGNHDIPRMGTVCLKDNIIKAFNSMLLTYPTAPFIYYGDEIGMRCIKDIASKEGAGPRAKSRTPMLWDSKKNAGFSTADPSNLYFPIDEDFRERNVKNQEEIGNSILNVVRKLITLRKANPSLGPFAPIRHLYLEKNSKSYIYSRYENGDGFVVALNPSDNPCSIQVALHGNEEEFIGKKFLIPEIGVSDAMNIKITNRISFDLPPNFYCVYKLI